MYSVEMLGQLAKVLKSLLTAVMWTKSWNARKHDEKWWLRKAGPAGRIRRMMER